MKKMSFLEKLFGSKKQNKIERRGLRIEPLEERQLLSTVGWSSTIDDVSGNATITADYTTETNNTNDIKVRIFFDSDYFTATGTVEDTDITDGNDKTDSYIEISITGNNWSADTWTTLDLNGAEDGTDYVLTKSASPVEGATNTITVMAFEGTGTDNIAKERLDAPIITTPITVTDNLATLTWSAVDNVDSYIVQQKTGAGGDWVTSTTTPITDSGVVTSVVSDLSADTEYSFRVMANPASDSTGYTDSVYSNEATVTTLKTLPEWSVTGYTGTYDGGNHLTVTAPEGWTSDNWTLQYRKGVEEGEPENDWSDTPITVQNVSDSGTYQVKASATGYADVIKFATITITAKALTIDTNAKTTVADKAYDGDTDADVTRGTVVGIIDGDDVTVTAAGVFDSKDVKYVEGAVVAQEVAVTYTLSGDDAGNYIVPVSETLNATINPKALTIDTETPTTVADKAYDGDTDADVTRGTVVGIIDGDDVSVTAAGVFDSKDVQYDTEGNVIAQNVTVTYTLSGADAVIKNYTAPENDTLQAKINPIALDKPVLVIGTRTNDDIVVSWADVTGAASYTLTVMAGETKVGEKTGLSATSGYSLKTNGELKLDAGTKYTLTVTAVPEDTNYKNTDSDPETAWTKLDAPTATATREVGGFTIDWEADTNANVTGYKLTYSPAGGSPSVTVTFDKDDPTTYTFNTADKSKNIEYNYTLQTLGTASLDIDSATTEGSVTTLKEIVYTAQNGGGVYNEDGYSITVSVTDPQSSSTVVYSLDKDGEYTGTNPVITDVTPGTEVFFKITAADYGDVAGSAFVTITAKQLSTPIVSKDPVTAEAITIKWETVPNASSYTVKYKMAGDTEWTDGTVDQDNLSCTVSNPTNNTTYSFKVVAEGEGNYSDSAEGTITVESLKTLPEWSVTGYTDTYDGTEHNAVTVTAPTTPLDGWKLQYRKGVTDVWTDTPITVKNVSDSGTYQVKASATGYADGIKDATIAITAKALTVTGLTAKDKDYDGKVTAEYDGTASLVDAIEGDDVEIDTITGTFADKNVGEDKEVTFAYTLKGADAGNYTVSESNDNATISAIALTIDTETPTTVADKAYDGDTDADVTRGTVVGIIAGDDVSVTAAGVFDSKDVQYDTEGNVIAQNVTVTYTLSGDDAVNYTAPENDILQATINPIEIADPELVIGTRTNDDISVSWTAVDNANSYEVQVYSVGTEEALVGSFSVDAAGSYSLKDNLKDADDAAVQLASGTLYKIVLEASNTDAVNYISGSDVETTATRLDAPSLLLGSPTPAVGGFTLAWSQETNPQATGYQLIINGDTANPITLGIDVTSYTVTGADPNANVDYTYSLQTLGAFVQVGDISWNINIDSALTDGSVTTLKEVTIPVDEADFLNAESTSSESINVEWEPVDPNVATEQGVTGYRVDVYKKISDTEKEFVKSVVVEDPAAESQIVDGLVPETDYSFDIYAVTSAASDYGDTFVGSAEAETPLPDEDPVWNLGTDSRFENCVNYTLDATANSVTLTGYDKDGTELVSVIGKLGEVKITGDNAKAENLTITANAMTNLDSINFNGGSANNDSVYIEGTVADDEFTIGAASVTTTTPIYAVNPYARLLSYYASVFGENSVIYQRISASFDRVWNILNRNYVTTTTRTANNSVELENGATVNFAGVNQTTLDVKAGDDTINVESLGTNYNLIGGDGDDTLDFSNASRIAINTGSTGAQNVIVGQSGTIKLNGDIENLVASRQSDRIDAAGNMVINGNGGSDTVNVSGDGQDIVLSGGRQSVVVRGNGTNSITLNNCDYSVVNTLSAGSNSTTRLSTNGGNRLYYYGGSGTDDLTLAGGNAYVNLGGGNDSIFAQNSWGTNFFFAGSGNDIIVGGNGADFIYGNSGNNILFGMGGSDRVFGGTGRDLLGASQTSNMAAQNANIAAILDLAQKEWLENDIQGAIDILGEASVRDGSMDWLFRGAGKQNVFYANSADRDFANALKFSPFNDLFID